MIYSDDRWVKRLKKKSAHKNGNWNAERFNKILRSFENSKLILESSVNRWDKKKQIWWG